QGKLAEALASLDAYLQMLPQGTDAYELKIGLLAKLHKDAEVLPWLEQASAKDRFNIGLKLLLARQCVRLGQPVRAERLYRELIDAPPTEEVYRDLFLLYKDHNPEGMAFVARLVDTTLESAIHRENAPLDNPTPARARAMIGALRGNSALARDLVKAACGQQK